jgi:fatty acid desaturase
MSLFQLIISIAASSVHSCLSALPQNNQEQAHAIIEPAYYISNKHYTSILTEEKLATLLYVTQKGKFIPVHATRHAVEVQPHSFLTSALDGGDG